MNLIRSFIDLLSGILSLIYGTVLPFLQNSFLQWLEKQMKVGQLTVIIKNKSTQNLTTRVYNKAASPQATLQIDEPTSFFLNILFRSDIGFAESYLAGDFSTPSLFDALHVLALNQTSSPARLSWFSDMYNAIQHRFKHNSLSNSKSNISAHYDLPPEFFKHFLDSSMTYSAGIFKDPEDNDLAGAQGRKIQLLLKQANLKPGDNLLEVGSGWGSLASYAAQNYNISVTSITISKEQYDYCVKHYGSIPNLKFVFLDFREVHTLKTQFNAIIACEMIEAVGLEYFEIFFKSLSSVLAPNGLIVLQAITIPTSRFDQYSQSCDFIQKFIFPGGLCPSLLSLQTAMKQTGLDVENVSNYPADYAKTLLLWNSNFMKNWPTIQKQFGFDEIFQRKWHYYFMYCAVGFHTRLINLLHITLTKQMNQCL